MGGRGLFNNMLEKIKKLLPFGLGVLLVVSLAGSYYFYSQLQSFKKSSDIVAAKELREVIASVSRLIRLPEDEEPILATVTDPEKLKDQPFFAKSKAGDKVLVYSKTEKAYLYDPVADILVDVGFVSTAGTGDAKSGTAAVKTQNTSTPVVPLVPTAPNKK